MPTSRTGRARTDNRNAQTSMSLTIFRHLTTAQSQEFCRRKGLPARGCRAALENRLKNFGITLGAEPGDQTAGPGCSKAENL